MNKSQEYFFQIFTDFQCFILANMNKGEVSGVTARHYHIIAYIYRKGKTTGKQLAMDFGVSQPAISRQIKFLLEHDMLMQKQSAHDRRIFYLEATPKGKFLIDNSESFRVHVTRQASTILSENELKQLSHLLDRVLSQLKLKEEEVLPKVINRP